MNYYQHHIGDFIRDTSRLSDSQCMAYLRLMWIYYETEQPIEGDIDAIAFRIGAAASDLAQIFKHFFFLHDDGLWHQARCDKEILAFRKKSEKAKDSANARWNNANAMRPHYERIANAPVFDANQEPGTSNQEPIDQKTCADPQAASPPKQSKSTFDYSTGLFNGLSAEMLAAWREAYPAIDVRQEIAKAKAWLLANPKNRKSNIERFLTNWLTKAQDNAPRINDGQAGFSNSGNQRPDNSAVGQVRAGIERDRAERAALARANGVGMANDDRHVRPQVGEQLRGSGGPGSGMGELLEGDFRRTD